MASIVGLWLTSLVNPALSGDLRSSLCISGVWWGLARRSLRRSADGSFEFVGWLEEIFGCLQSGVDNGCGWPLAQHVYQPCLLLYHVRHNLSIPELFLLKFSILLNAGPI